MCAKTNDDEVRKRLGAPLTLAMSRAVWKIAGSGFSLRALTVVTTKSK